MAERKFFVNNGQANLGPFEMRSIIDKVGKGELRAVDNICVNADNDEWVLICQHPEFLKHFEVSAKPSLHENGHSNGHDQGHKHERGHEHGGAEVHQLRTNPAVERMPPPSEKALTNVPKEQHEEKKMTHSQMIVQQTPLPEAVGPVGGDLTTGQWYVLKGKNRFGPFLYLDLIRMLQEKSVFEYDYVWVQGLEGWKRIAEIQVFSAEHIRGLFGSDEEKENKLFHRRNYPRSNYEATIIVHDNSNVWKGKTVEVSEGGAGVVIDNALILPGQNVYLHFKPGPLSKSFNVLCEVVSKRYVKGIRDKDAPVVYGIKFININKQDREAIRLIHGAA